MRFLIRLWVKSGWLIVAVVADMLLGGAALTYYKSSDTAVVRDGHYSVYFHVSLIFSGFGLLLAILSIILILIRLGWLKL